MASSSSDNDGRENDVNFELGFNNPKFSDRVLRLEIAHRRKNPTVLSLFIRKKNVEGEPVTSVKVKSVHINSLMLAANSQFFHKLFDNGMSESQKKGAEVTLQISAPEEAPFMDMLSFIYKRPLKATSRAELMDVLMVADKYDVTSCMRRCTELLLRLPMTTEQDIYILEFPSELFVNAVTQPVLDQAKQHLSAHFSGLSMSQQEEAMSLPLCAIEVIVGSADFQVNSEEDLLGFILKWGRQHYPKLEERRDVLTKHLLKLICFPCLSVLKLKEVVRDCPDFVSEELFRLAFNALSYKIELPYGPNSTPIVNETLFSSDTLANCLFPRRAYCHHRVIFFDMKKQDLVDMVSNSARVYSETFCLGGQCFSLFARRQRRENLVENFGLFVEMAGSGSFRVTFEFSAKKNPSCEFHRLNTPTTQTFTEINKKWGYSNVFNMPWTELMGDDDHDYIIDGVLHIRAQLTMPL